MKNFQIIFLVILAMQSCSGQNSDDKELQVKEQTVMNKEMNEEKINKSEDEWRKQLTPGQFHILREKGTEYPFTGKFYKHSENGMYVCAGCGAELFSSETKFDAGCGWPSFYESLNNKVDTAVDNSQGMLRIEIKCKKCGGHLGHVFNDGPQPTGLRYCVNSESLDFKK